MKGFGIGFVPCARHAKALTAASIQLNDKLHFRRVLNESDNYPHLSLIHLRAGSSREFADVEESFSRVCREHRSDVLPSCMPSKISYVEVGWCFLDLVRSQPLVDWHQLVFIHFRRFLRPLTESRDLSLLSNEEQESFRAYGYRYVGEAFRPHVTLGRLQESVRRDTSLIETSCASELELPGVIELSDLVLFELGADGTCKKIIAGLRL